MAAYDYRCESCGATTERRFPFSVSLNAVLSGACDEPGCCGDLRRVYSAPGISMDAATGGRTVR